MATPTIANTLLCLFSNDQCILIDDCKQKLVSVTPIASIWPQLSQYGMDSNLNAAYFCPEHSQVAFFQGSNCAIYNYITKQLAHGPIKNYFVVPKGCEDFYDGINGASTGVREENIAFYKYRLPPYTVDQGCQFINGPIGDPTASPVQLTQGPSALDSSGWKLNPNQHVVATTLMCRTSGSDQGDPTNPLRALIFKDTDETYQFTFDNPYNPTPPISGNFSLKTLWPEYDDNKYPIQAATRVDPSVIAHVVPVPGSGPYPQQGPGPVLPQNPLCDELGNIMKSVCSLTLLMHKAIDACYPPSSWPTQPYPDGCSSSGHKRPCGCKGSPMGGPGDGGPTQTGPGPMLSGSGTQTR